jgi:hypothetical protein
MMLKYDLPQSEQDAMFNEWADRYEFFKEWADRYEFYKSKSLGNQRTPRNLERYLAMATSGDPDAMPLDIVEKNKMLYYHKDNQYVPGNRLTLRQKQEGVMNVRVPHVDPPRTPSRGPAIEYFEPPKRQRTSDEIPELRNLPHRQGANETKQRRVLMSRRRGRARKCRCA